MKKNLDYTRRALRAERCAFGDAESRQSNCASCAEHRVPQRASNRAAHRSPHAHRAVCARLSALAALAFALLFASCAKKGAGEIKFALDWTPNTNHTGLFVAQKLGFFAEEGLRVEITQPNENGAALMVASGTAQFGVEFQDTLASAFAGKSPVPVTAVAAILQHNTSKLVSLKSKGIDRPAALQGHSYATWESPVELAMLRNIVESDGGDFAKVALVPSTVQDVVAALQTDIDAVWIYYAWEGIALELAGLQTNSLDFAEINPIFDYYTPVIIANNDFLQSNAEISRKFLRAVKRGYEYAAQNPAEAAAILCECVPELDKTLVEKSQKWIGDYYVADSSHWGYIDGARWNAFYAWLSQNALVELPLPPDCGFTNEFLEK